MHYLLVALVLCISVAYGVTQNYKSHHTAFPDNDLWVPASTEYSPQNEWDNGYQEEDYNKVLDTFYELYAPRIEALGGTFVIERDWIDGSVNAFSWKGGTQYGIEIPGGMSRYELINEEAFILVICHEMGHVLGGGPHRYGTSFEGQSDYFSSLKCMREVLPLLPRKDIPVFEDCNEAFDNMDELQTCSHTLRGALALSSLYARVERIPYPKIETPDPSVVSKTDRRHPSAQCRLDTVVAGALCPADPSVDVSLEDPAQGACVRPEFEKEARPKCWYRPEL